MQGPFGGSRRGQQLLLNLEFEVEFAPFEIAKAVSEVLLLPVQVTVGDYEGQKAG